MNSRNVRIALIGCGEIVARSTLRCVVDSGCMRVGAAMDPHIDLARDLAARCEGAYATDSYDRILDDASVDAVLISSPHHLHVAQGIAAARHGKHILLEKPIAISVSDGRRLIDVCKEFGVLLGILYPAVFSSTALRIRECIARGVLGRLTGFSIFRFMNKKDDYWTSGYSGRVESDWRARRETAGGGCLLMNMSHNLNMIQYVLDLRPRSVFAAYDTFNTDVEVEDFCNVVVRYSRGAIGSVFCGSSTPGGVKEPDRILGTAGQIEIHRYALRIYTERNVPGIPAGEWHEEDLPETSARAAGCLNFGRALQGAEELAPTAEYALRTLSVIEGAYRSQEMGRPVEIVQDLAGCDE